MTGEVTFKLYKGNIIKAGETSPYSIYDEDIASFTTGELYDHKDASGFITLFGLSTWVRAMKMQQQSGKAHHKSPTTARTARIAAKNTASKAKDTAKTTARKAKTAAKSTADKAKTKAKETAGKAKTKAKETAARAKTAAKRAGTKKAGSNSGDKE